jgi:uncharacterized protein
MPAFVPQGFSSVAGMTHAPMDTLATQLFFRQGVFPVIDFEKAKAIWDDPDFIEIPAKVVDEPGFIVIGKLDGKLWSAVITCRKGKIRIISVRRSRFEEEAIYESQAI